MAASVEAGAAAGVCPRCEGRGWLVELDGGAGTARPCDCRQLELVPRLLEAAGIPPRYREKTMASFTADRRFPSLLAARRQAELYVEGFLGEEGTFRSDGLLFIGPPGVGKTHLAVAVLKELIGRYGVRDLFVDFTGLIHRIQSTFDPNSAASKHDVLDPVITAELLVLDELGAQKPTPWVQDTLYLILNARYARRLPTLFTTNFRLEPARPERELDRGPEIDEFERLASRIPATLLSRLYEMASRVVIDADDYRREIRQFQVGRSHDAAGRPS